MLLRCTGRVLRRDAREGTATRTGKPYRIPFVTVLVADQGVAEINIPEMVEAQVDNGQDIDWLVEVTAFGQTAQARYVDRIQAPARPVPAMAPAAKAG